MAATCPDQEWALLWVRSRHGPREPLDLLREPHPAPATKELISRHKHSQELSHGHSPSHPLSLASAAREPHSLVGLRQGTPRASRSSSPGFRRQELEEEFQPLTVTLVPLSSASGPDSELHWSAVWHPRGDIVTAQGSGAISGSVGHKVSRKKRVCGCHSGLQLSKGTWVELGTSEHTRTTHQCTGGRPLQLQEGKSHRGSDTPGIKVRSPHQGKKPPVQGSGWRQGQQW